ncbi:MAG: succinate dehydrogenase iron-sulfur subunit [Planctomycetota bacterium]
MTNSEGIALFDVYRFNPKTDAAPRRQRFEVDLERHMTVLDGLRQIQDRRDCLLAFRASCQGGRCGGCAMRINGRIRLACETRIEALRRRVVRVDPLPNLTVIRDLVVDMDPFWRSYEQVRPWLSPDVQYVECERLQTPKERERFCAYIVCILCGACYAACPVVRRSPWFLGPAALAKAFRFAADSRETEAEERLDALNSHAGVWGCDAIFRCVHVCPKGVPPAHAIAAMRRRLVMTKARQLFRLIPFGQGTSTGQW